jgi:hypothetical protein
MASRQTVKNAQVFSQDKDRPVMAFSSETRLHEEDGWIFSERPGKGVQCLGRAGEVSEPYIRRHSYPSA